jgi:tetratricopeptide (TPR) repeat protein
MKLRWPAAPGMISLAVLLLVTWPGQTCGAEASLQTSTSLLTPEMVKLSPEARGDIYLARGEYEQAIEAYREAPRTAEVWDKTGVAWHHLDAIGEARHDYQRALLIRPNYPEAINNLGATYFAQRDYKKAIRLYRQALRLMPKSAVIAANLGTAYFARGKYRQGFEAYRRAFQLDPTVFDEPDSLSNVAASTSLAYRAHEDYCLAELFAQAGMQKQAIEYLTRALNEGFDDRQQIMQDSVFAHLRKTQEFAQLMAAQKLR